MPVPNPKPSELWHPVNSLAGGGVAIVKARAVYLGFLGGCLGQVWSAKMSSHVITGFSSTKQQRACLSIRQVLQATTRKGQPGNIG
eukprot:5341494-Amphidinium_carterae.1